LSLRSYTEGFDAVFAAMHGAAVDFAASTREHACNKNKERGIQ